LELLRSWVAREAIKVEQVEKGTEQVASRVWVTRVMDFSTRKKELEF